MNKRLTLSALLLILLSIQGFYYLIDYLDYHFNLGSSLYGAISDLWVLASGVWAFYLLKHFRNKDYWQFKLNWPNVGYVLVSFLLMLVIVLFSNIFFPLTINGQGLVETSFAPSAWDKLFMPIYIMLVAPICEELIHRGVVMTVVDGYTKGKLGWLLSSITFSILHLPYDNISLTDFIKYFAMGLVFGWVYKKSNSIYWAIIAHIVWNTFVFLMSRG